MKEKQAVTREYKTQYQAATKQAKSALLDECIRLTGYHRTYAARVLRTKPVREVLLSAGGGAVKLKPEKKRPANRTGKRMYTDEVIAALRLVWTFFWNKCGKILAPFMRRQMAYIAGWPAFHITEDIAEKLKKISPRTRFRGGDHRPVSEKGQGRAEAEREKPHQTPCFPEKPYPDTHFLRGGGAEPPRFPAN